MNAWRLIRRAAALITVAGLLAPVSAQSTPPRPSTPAAPDAVVRSLIPDVISLRRPQDAALSFALSALNYPPVKFPARYLSDAQEFAVFSSSPRPWTVQLQVIPHPDARGNVLEVGKLSYRLGGGEWLPVLATSQVILSGVAPTLGWNPLKLEFALDLSGDEVSGDASFDLRFTANVLP